MSINIKTNFGPTTKSLGDQEHLECYVPQGKDNQRKQNTGK